MERRSAGPAARAAAAGAPPAAFELGRVGLVLAGADQRPQLDPAGLRPCGWADGCTSPGSATPCAASSSPNTQSTASSTAGVERKETLRSTGTKLLSATRLRSANHSRISLSLRGSARWKPKIDCLMSPTANTVRAALDRALADEELLGQAADHLPLVGVGVLRLVDQHMVDAAVELVEHPGGAVGALQQRGAWRRSGRRSRAPRAAAWRGV